MATKKAFTPKTAALVLQALKMLQELRAAARLVRNEDFFVSEIANSAFEGACVRAGQLLSDSFAFNEAQGDAWQQGFAGKAIELLRGLGPIGVFDAFVDVAEKYCEAGR